MDGKSGSEEVSYGQWFFVKFCLEFSRFRKIDLQI